MVFSLPLPEIFKLFKLVHISNYFLVYVIIIFCFTNFPDCPWRNSKFWLWIFSWDNKFLKTMGCDRCKLQAVIWTLIYLVAIHGAYAKSMGVQNGKRKTLWLAITDIHCTFAPPPTLKLDRVFQPDHLSFRLCLLLAGVAHSCEIYSVCGHMLHLLVL